MPHRSPPVGSLALALVVSMHLGARAIAQSMPDAVPQGTPSASPIATPSSAAPSTGTPFPAYHDPDVHPSSAASRAWIRQLRRTAYVGASGHRFLFGSALTTLLQYTASQPIAGFEPGIVRDAKRGLLKVCFVVSPCRANSSYTIVVRAADVPAPPSSVAGTIDDATIGMTVAALLAYFHADGNLVSKNIVKDATGAVYLITSHDDDPPPGKYDHGFQAYADNQYIVRDDSVVAHIAVYSEN